MLSLSTISTPSSLSSSVVRMLNALSSEEAEEAGSQANSMDSGLSELFPNLLESTNDNGGAAATGMKCRRPVAIAEPARAMPARQRRKPARYQAEE